MFNGTKSNDENTTEEIQQQKKRCFVIMPFSDPDGYTPGHFFKVYLQIIKPAVENAGYEAYRVDENSVSDLITTKIFKAILDCDMAICDLSSRNPNVLYELGIRHAFDKPVVLIKDNKTDRIFDIQGISTVEYRCERLYDEVIEDQKKISEAIKENEDSSSGYSILNMVNLPKATYDTNTKDSHEFNNALLMRLISALDKTEQNRIKINEQWDYEKENIRIINYELDAIISNINYLDINIKKALENKLQIDTPKIGNEINQLYDKIEFYLKSGHASKRQLDELLYQKRRLDNVLDRLYLLEERYSSEQNHS
ncbi:MAG: hypothetical protein NC395_11335 [Prevotella sp.]|nr:hypothetical protein [Prevotella sp.]